MMKPGKDYRTTHLQPGKGYRVPQPPRPVQKSAKRKG